MQNELQEGLRVLLDKLRQSGVALSQLHQELLHESWVLQDPLPDRGEVRTLNQRLQSFETLVGSGTLASTAATSLLLLDAVDFLGRVLENFEGQIGVASRDLQSLDDGVAGLRRHDNQVLDSFLHLGSHDSGRLRLLHWSGLGLWLGDGLGLYHRRWLHRGLGHWRIRSGSSLCGRLNIDKRRWVGRFGFLGGFGRGSCRFL